MADSLIRKNYWSLDIAKFFCSILIISAHFASEWASFPTMVDYAFSLYVIAVPFFFCCSGFLFFKKLISMQTKTEQWTYFCKYEKRIWIMYGLWTLVYFPFVLLSWIRKGTLGLETILRYLHMALVSQTYSTIWFLPALAVGIAILYLLYRKCSFRMIAVISVVLYIIGMFGYTYHFVVDDSFIGKIYDVYMLLFKTIRNGLFNGVPFLFVGCVAAAKNIQPSRKRVLKYACSAGISIVAMVIECFVLKLKWNVTGMDICIFVVPFTVFFLLAMLHLDLRERRLFLWLRKLSLLIFVSQRLFLSALPSLFPRFFEPLYANSYLGLCVVIGVTIAFSLLFSIASNKITFLKKMI